jgi:hypothetical protein
VNFLPAIDWSPDYLERIAADPHGDVAPTPEEIEASQQRNCILYSYIGRPERRNGPANRTSFMYTLDQLGYREGYDVYFQMPGGIASNPLGCHATVEQATGYALIVLDPLGYGWYAIPDGSGVEHIVDMNRWYRDWFAQAATSEAGRAALWLMGEDVVEENIWRPNHLIANEMGVTLVAPTHGLAGYPGVRGQGTYTWPHGAVSDFTADDFVLVDKWCNRPMDYDALGATGSASITHRFASGVSLADGAVVINGDSAAAWSTVVMSLSWGDIREADGAPRRSAASLAQEVLEATLPVNCQAIIDSTTDAPENRDLDDSLPRVTLLHQNVPNPFNPTTTLRFDVAWSGNVDLRIHDVAGRLVRKLFSAELDRKSYQFVWDGRDETGRQVASGIYLAHLRTVDAALSKKLVVLR